MTQISRVTIAADARHKRRTAHKAPLTPPARLIRCFHRGRREKMAATAPSSSQNMFLPADYAETGYRSPRVLCVMIPVVTN